METEAGHATPVHEPGAQREKGGLWGQSPWGEYTLNHKNIVNVFDTNL